MELQYNISILKYFSFIKPEPHLEKNKFRLLQEIGLVKSNILRWIKRHNQESNEKPVISVYFM